MIAGAETSPDGTGGPRQTSDPDLYPLALKLAGVPVLVVGGGNLALHKTRDLLRSGAVVRIVSPEWHPEFSRLDPHPGVARVTRAFRESDLDTVFLVVAATDDRDTQSLVAAGAFRRRLLCNVVDVPELCNFYVPAVLRRGALLVAVTTAGKSPLLAGAVKNLVAKIIGPHVTAFLDRLGDARQIVRSRYPDAIERRKSALERLLSPEAFDHIIANRADRFESHWRTWESSLSD